MDWYETRPSSALTMGTGKGAWSSQASTSKKAASWEVSLLEASPSHLHGYLGSADSLSESYPGPYQDADPPATGLD